MRGYLSLGSNSGKSGELLAEALAGLEKRMVRVLEVSSVYETRPVEVETRQENYLNMAAEITTDLSPEKLLEACNEVENSLGRTRPYHHAPRTMDIDILILDDLVIRTDKLTVPHPRLEKRAFVIHPLSEIAPNLCLPSGRNIIEVKTTLGDDDILEIRKMKDGNFSRHKKKGSRC